MVSGYITSGTYHIILRCIKCKLIDGCSLERFLATHSLVSSGICHINEVDSIAWLRRDGLPKSPWDCISYITLHKYYITLRTSHLHPVHPIQALLGTSYPSVIIITPASTKLYDHHGHHRNQQHHLHHPRRHRRRQLGVLFINSSSSSSSSSSLLSLFTKISVFK